MVASSPHALMILLGSHVHVAKVFAVVPIRLKIAGHHDRSNEHPGIPRARGRPPPAVTDRSIFRVPPWGGDARVLEALDRALAKMGIQIGASLSIAGRDGRLERPAHGVGVSSRALPRLRAPSRHVVVASANLVENCP